MDNNKYYTPEIESKYFVPDISDLFIGYEYEYSLQSTHLPDGMDWKKYTISESDMCTNYTSGWDTDAHIGFIIGAVKNGRIRVPYLSKQDIEELGWKFIEGTYEFIIESEGIKYIVNLQPIIQDLHKSRFIAIFRCGLSYEFTREKDLLYQGYCPSKNELKKLMKMLNINEGKSS